jgi:hypothetical protein
MYYLRTKAAVDAIKLNNDKKVEPIEVKAQPIQEKIRSYCRFK